MEVDERRCKTQTQACSLLLCIRERYASVDLVATGTWTKSWTNWKPHTVNPLRVIGGRGLSGIRGQQARHIGDAAPTS